MGLFNDEFVWFVVYVERRVIIKSDNVFDV